MQKRARLKDVLIIIITLVYYYYYHYYLAKWLIQSFEATMTELSLMQVIMLVELVSMKIEYQNTSLLP